MAYFYWIASVTLGLMLGVLLCIKQDISDKEE